VNQFTIKRDREMIRIPARIARASRSISQGHEKKLFTGSEHGKRLVACAVLRDRHWHRSHSQPPWHGSRRKRQKGRFGSLLGAGHGGRHGPEGLESPARPEPAS
jgi:hypothetical protein